VAGPALSRSHLILYSADLVAMPTKSPLSTEPFCAGCQSFKRQIDCALDDLQALSLSLSSSPHPPSWPPLQSNIIWEETGIEESLAGKHSGAATTFLGLVTSICTHHQESKGLLGCPSLGPWSEPCPGDPLCSAPQSRTRVSKNRVPIPTGKVHVHPASSKSLSTSLWDSSGSAAGSSSACALPNRS
jgi:hypothetical protein